MTTRQVERTAKLLTDLIAIRSVNPMGTHYQASKPVEHSVVEFLERWFDPLDVSVSRDPFSQWHENLLISVEGETNGPATLISSHMDTVPADDWAQRAFTPRVEDDTVYGRGSCDDKGSLAAMILAVSDLLEAGRRPPQPVLFLATGDEEYAQSGIRHFLTTNKISIGRSIFGEPTRCIPIIQHKATVRWDVTVHGRSAHSSCAELGRNAIIDMLQVIERLQQLQNTFRQRYTSSLLTGPSLTVTKIEGGRTRNAVPDACSIAVDFRVPPEIDAKVASREVIDALSALEIDLTHSEFQTFSPALNTSATDPFTLVVLNICRNHLQEDVEALGENFGTDAAWMDPQIPTLVMGPGDISTAHAIDECIDIDQVLCCAEIYSSIISHDWQAGPTS